MVGLMPKTHTQMTSHSGRTLTEMDTATTQAVRHLMRVQRRAGIQRLATDMDVLTRMAMDGMMSSMNCRT